MDATTLAATAAATATTKRQTFVLELSLSGLDVRTRFLCLPRLLSVSAGKMSKLRGWMDCCGLLRSCASVHDFNLHTNYCFLELTMKFFFSCSSRPTELIPVFDFDVPCRA